VHILKACGRVGLQLYWMEISGEPHALERGCPLNKRVGGPEIPPGRSGEGRSLFHLLGI